MAAARHSIRLETYIYAAGPAGEGFRDALVQARHRGARVQVMADAVGSRYLSESFWVPLAAAGGEFKWFNPLSLRRLSHRDHRKILVCDEQVAFVGGFNIAAEYEGDGITRGWRDLGLQITGPLAAELAHTFDQLFAHADFKPKRLRRLRRARDHVALGHHWQLLLSGPGWRHGEIKRRLARDLATAQTVQIISAYFLPTWRLRQELVRVRRRGGRVQLVLAGKTDVKLSQLASRRLYGRFLRRGIEIYEYQPQILHAKLFLVDGVVYAGSSNLDSRSLRINYELSVRLSEPGVVAEARGIFEDVLRHCRRIDPATWRRSRTFWNKLKERWAYFVLARLDPYLARWQLKNLK